LKIKIGLLIISLFIALIICSTASATEIINKNSNGKLPNGDSSPGSMSSDGRFVVFSSEATNLVAGDTNNMADLFLKDKYTNKTTRISLTKTGKQITTGTDSTGVISANGNYIVICSNGNLGWSNSTRSLYQLYLYNRVTKSLELISKESNGTAMKYGGRYPSISADGRYVAFVTDCIVRDTTYNANINNVFVYDRFKNETQNLSIDIKSNNRYNDNGYGASVPSISDNGRYIAFNYFSGSLGKLFIYDRQTNTTRSILGINNQTPNGDLLWPKISGNGRYVTFYSKASNLDPRDTNIREDVYITDLSQPTLHAKLVSVSTTNGVGNGRSYLPSISYNGRYVAFLSGATNLAANIGNRDTNFFEDVFVRDMILNKTIMESLSSNGNVGNGYCVLSGISYTGKYVLFGSNSTNLVNGTNNGRYNGFVNLVDFQAPIITSKNPKSNSTGYSKNSAIYIKFNENIRGTSYFNHIKIKDLTTGKYIPIIKTTSGSLMILKTKSARIKNHTYQVYIPSKAVQDYLNNNLQLAYTFKFKSGG